MLTSFRKIYSQICYHLSDKPSIKGSEIGDVRLVFMGDYYTRLFQCPFDESSLYQTMSDFAADVKLPVLYRYDFTFLLRVIVIFIAYAEIKKILFDKLLI